MEWPRVAPGEVWVGCYEKFLLRKSGDALAQLPREVVGSPSLEVLTERGEVAPRDVLCRQCWWLVGLDDPSGLFQP